MDDNSEGSFIAPASQPWYKKIPMPIWVALIGASATIFAAALQSGLFTSQDQPAGTIEPTEIAQTETGTRAPKSCGETTVHPIFKLQYDKHKDVLGCPSDPFYTPTQLAEQLFEGGHIFWLNGHGQRMFVVLDQSKTTGADLQTGEWFSTIGPRNNPYPEDLHDTEDKNPNGIGLVPPPDLYEPIGGMGWLWRTHLNGAEGDLGWAKDEMREHIDLGLYQEFDWGVMFKASDPMVYILLDTRNFYAERPPE